jgi:hypothetical protein
LENPPGRSAVHIRGADCLGISGLFGSEEELADHGQREKSLHPAALAAAKVYFLVEHSDGDVGIEKVLRRYLPLMDVYPLATVLDRLHHLVSGFVVQGAGHLK